MDSIRISEDFNCPVEGWGKLNRAMGEEFPESQGVYVVRLAGGKPIPRLKGQSDIVYIGQGNIKKRAKAHTNLRPDFQDKGWQLVWIANQMGVLEIGFHLCEKSKGEELEREFLSRYLMDHLELPPANNQKPELSNIAQATIIFECLTEEKRRKLVEESLKRRSTLNT